MVRSLMMLENEIHSKEFQISYYLHNNFRIEQMRFGMYNPDNAYYQIPMLIFRFSKLYGPGIYDEFQKCIEKYNGNLEWAVFSRLKNNFTFPSGCKNG